MQKKLSMLLIILTLIFQSLLIHATEKTVKIYLDSEELTFEQNPVIINNRTMVPLRAILEELGINVSWEARTQTVTCFSGDKTVVLKINDPLATINGVVQYIDSPAVLRGNVTMVPLRFIAENYYLDVRWDASQYAVFLSSQNAYESKLAAGLPVKIVFLGDSTTAVTKYTNGKPNHVELAADWLDKIYPDQVTVINSGKIGDNIINMLDRLDQAVIKYNPDLVIICSGLNDANGTVKISVEDYTANYIKIIEQIQAKTNAAIIIRTPNPFTITSSANKQLELYNRASMDIATDYNLTFFDLYTKMSNDIISGVLIQSDIMTDSTHPNGVGHEYIFNQLKPFLTSSASY